MSLDDRASMKQFLGVYAMSFMPGQWGSIVVVEPIRDKLCVHFSASEPVTAEFEIALDGVIQECTLTANVDLAFKHTIATCECKNPVDVRLRRKESDSTVPVFVLGLDGA